MSDQPLMTALILPFCRPGTSGNQLTPRDRADTWKWEEEWHRSGVRIAICDASPTDWVELGSCVNLYRTGQSWPDCTLTRQAGVLRAWWCADGTDIGVFPSVQAAFAELFPLLGTVASPQPDEAAGRAASLYATEWQDSAEQPALTGADPWDFESTHSQTLSAG